MMDALKRVKLKPQLYESTTKIQLPWKWGKCVECEDPHVLKNMKIIIWACFSLTLQKNISGLERKHNLLGTTARETQQSSWVFFDSYKAHFSGFGKGEIPAMIAPRLGSSVPQPCSCISCWWQRGVGGWWQQRMDVSWGQGHGPAGLSTCGCGRAPHPCLHPDGCSWLTQAIRSGCCVWLIQWEAEQNIWEHVCVKVETLTEAGYRYSGFESLKSINALIKMICGADEEYIRTTLTGETTPGCI